jgi:hypothetical protein
MDKRFCYVLFWLNCFGFSSEGMRESFVVSKRSRRRKSSRLFQREIKAMVLRETHATNSSGDRNAGIEMPGSDWKKNVVQDSPHIHT